MKSLYKQIILILTIVILASCNNETIDLQDEKENKALSIQEYFKVLKIKPKGGRILLESTASIDFKNDSRISSISCTQIRIKKSFTLGHKKTKVVNQFKNGFSKNTSNLFGQTFEYNIEGTVFQKNGNNNEVYIPELLDIDIDTPTLQVGTVITWNVDILNTNGLILWYEYTPIIQDKIEVLNDNKKRITSGITIPDVNGSYTITANDIVNLPNNARITFHVTRAGFDISNNTSDGNQIAFIGITSASKELRINK